MTVASALTSSASPADRPLDYRILATSATSTMERELNEAGVRGIASAKPLAAYPQTADQR